MCTPYPCHDLIARDASGSSLRTHTHTNLIKIKKYFVQDHVEEVHMYLDTDFRQYQVMHRRQTRICGLRAIALRTSKGHGSAATGAMSRYRELSLRKDTALHRRPGYASVLRFLFKARSCIRVLKRSLRAERTDIEAHCETALANVQRQQSIVMELLSFQVK
jgi:hypothetical protein